MNKVKRDSRRNLLIAQNIIFDFKSFIYAKEEVS